MKLTEKLNTILEAKIPSGKFKFVKAIGKSGEVQGTKSAKGSIGEFSKGPKGGFDFESDSDSLYIKPSNIIKKTGKTLTIVDSIGVTYTFEAQ
jgi:hypothetical protein